MSRNAIAGTNSANYALGNCDEGGELMEEVAESVLKAELETYHRELPTLLTQAGKYALISGDRVIEVFDTYEDALKTGYKTVGLQPFLVKKIQAIEQVQTITRLFIPCLT